MEQATLLSDKDWSLIDGHWCLVQEFNPMAKMENGVVTAISPQLPYASVLLEVSGHQIRGYVTHKTDFAMLWSAFNRREGVPGVRIDLHPDVEAGVHPFSDEGLGEDEDVWIIWSRKNYAGVARLMNKFLPRLVVAVIYKGDLSAPLIRWTPDVMK